MIRRIIFIHQPVSFSGLLSFPALKFGFNFMAESNALFQNNDAQSISSSSSSSAAVTISKTKRILKMLQIQPSELERLRHNMRKAGFRSKRSPKSVNTSWSSFNERSFNNSATDGSRDPSAAGDATHLHKPEPEMEEPTFRELLLLKQRDYKRNRASTVPMKILQQKKRARYFSPEFRLEFYFKESDIEEGSCLGHGPGGQATNRRMQTSQIRHVPSGICIRMSKFRSLYANRKTARVMLSQRLEQLMFGEFSRLGDKMKKSMLQRRAYRQKRDRLDRFAEKLKRQEEGTSNGSHEEASKNPTAAFAPPTKSESPFIQQCWCSTSSSLADVVVGKQELWSAQSKQNQNFGCWKFMNFYSPTNIVIDDGIAERQQQLSGKVTYESMLNETGLVVDFSSSNGKDLVAAPPKKRSQLLESPFVENWFKILEFSFNKGNCDNSTNHDLNCHCLAICGTCCCVPFWFLTLFPSLPSSSANNLQAVLGPSSAWECRERSYLKGIGKQGKSDVESKARKEILLKPYRHFFEMWGIRDMIVLEKSTRTEKYSIDRDEGLNWVEGRNKILGNKEMFSLLWLHVYCSAIELELDDVAKAMKDFSVRRSKAESENNAQVRALFDEMLKMKTMN